MTNEVEKPKSLALFGDKYVSDYKEGKVKAPADVRPEADDPQFYLDFANWAYSRYCNGFTQVLPGGYMPNMNADRSITELRLYGRGQQPIEKYKARIDVSKIEGLDGKKLGLVNISWDQHRVYPKFREIIIDRLMSVEHEPTIVAIDSPSLRKKQLQYASDKLAAMGQSKAFFQQIGMKPDGLNEDIDKMTPADVEVMNQLGGYRVAVEIAMKEAAMASIQFSNYDPELRRQLTEDQVDLGIHGTHQKFDKASGRQIIEYIDPAGLIMPISEYDDCRDIDYAGFLKNRTISYLRQCSDLTEQQLMEIAKQYSSVGANGLFTKSQDGFAFSSRGNYAQRFAGTTPYDQFQIQTMTLYFVALDVERFIVGYRPEGNRIFDKVKRDAELNDRDEKRGKGVQDNVIQYVYRCEWIVGTNTVFNYGVEDVVVREGTPGAMRARLPIAVYRSNQPSVTAACVGAIDDLQLAVYKKRHALSVMPPAPNVAIDTAIMEDSMQLGAYKLDPIDMIDIYAVKGYLFYRSKSEYGLPGDGASNRPPITPLGDNTEKYLIAMQSEMQAAIQSLREISGVNELTDGTGNPRDVLNQVAASYEQSSNRSISRLYTAMTSHYKSMVNLLVRGYQSVSAYGGRNIHYLPIGTDVVRMVQMYPEYSMNELDISVKPGFDKSRRDLTFQALISNRDQQKITEDVYLTVLNIIQTGSIEQAQFVLAKAVADKAREDQANQIELMRQQSAAQAEQAQLTEQAKQQTVAMEGDVKSKQIVLEAQEERETEKLKSQLRIEEMKMQSTMTQNQPLGATG